MPWGGLQSWGSPAVGAAARASLRAADTGVWGHAVLSLCRVVLNRHACTLNTSCFMLLAREFSLLKPTT